MLVNQIMTTNVKTVTAETPLRQVVSTMCLYRISGLPVVDDNHAIIGFIAEKDILHHLFPSLEDLMENFGGMNFDEMMDSYKDVVNLKVKDLMIKKVIAVSPDMHILKATSVMVKHKFRRIPVVDNNQLVGMMSIGDVHKAIFQQSFFMDKVTESVSSH